MGPLSLVEIKMIIQLGSVFGIKVSKTLATSLLGAVAGSIGGKTIANALTFWIPGVGQAVNAATAVSTVEAIGWAVAKKFDNGDY